MSERHADIERLVQNQQVVRQIGHLGQEATRFAEALRTEVERSHDRLTRLTEWSDRLQRELAELLAFVDGERPDELITVAPEEEEPT